MLDVKNLGKTFANGTVALDGVTLRVDEGEILTIVGGSGSGKSTLLRLLAGLDRPSAGAITIDSLPVDGPHPAIGLVFQEPRLLPWLSVEDNVGFGLADLSAKERRTRVEDSLRKVGLEGLGGRWPKELSGGQGQRVALARALVTRPSVLLLDEPFSALDAFTRVELQDHLIELWSDVRPTLILVTHDIEEAVALGTRIVVLSSNPGRIASSFSVPLPRPRDRFSAAFDDIKKRVLGSLDASRTRGAAVDLGVTS